MEYDNDKTLKGTHKSELLCWLFFAIIYPTVNSFGVFPNQKIAWIVLLVISFLLLPLYMLYSRLIVIKFLFRKKYLIYVLADRFILFFHINRAAPAAQNRRIDCTRPGTILFFIFNSRHYKGNGLGFNKHLPGYCHLLV